MFQSNEKKKRTLKIIKDSNLLALKCKVNIR